MMNEPAWHTACQIESMGSTLVVLTQTSSEMRLEIVEPEPRGVIQTLKHWIGKVL